MTAANSTAPPEKFKRSIRNFMLDSRFQLKYTAWMLFGTVVISAILGTFLLKTSAEVVAQSEKVAAESKKVSDVMKMQVKDDPVYALDPTLAKAVGAAASSSDAEVQNQQHALKERQQGMLKTVVGALLALVLLIGMLGIYTTHKIVGPIYMMKALLKQVGDGKLNFNRKPRKGDELQDFFEVFSRMVEKLKKRQRTEVQLLEDAIDAAKASGMSKEAAERFEKIKNDMRRPLEE